MDEVMDEHSIIRAGDVFVLTVESPRESLRVITLSGSPVIAVPDAGTIRLQGLTLREARERIRQAAGRNADTTIRLWVYRPR